MRPQKISLKIPGTDYYISLDAAQPLNTADSQPLLAAIVDWLSKEFGLPVVDRFPEIKLISPGEIGALRYNSPMPPASHEVARDPGLAQPQSSAYLPTNDTVAVYIDGAEIIYLIESWTGRTPADLSVRANEMVHHLQYKLGFKHEVSRPARRVAGLAKGVLPTRAKYSHNVGYWQTEVGQLNEGVHLWVYKDLNERAAVRAKAMQDPAWQAFLGKAIPCSSSRSRRSSTPTGPSPMK